MKIVDYLFVKSFLVEMIEFSLLFGYSIFQMIFKSGQSVEEEAMRRLPHTPIRRYDKIDEILNSLVAEDDEIKFDGEKMDVELE